MFLTFCFVFVFSQSPHSSSSVASKALGVAHSRVHLLSEGRVGPDKEMRHGVVDVTKVLFSVGECSFDRGRDKAHPGFQFVAMQQQTTNHT
jgi:hypothetical protein